MKTCEECGAVWEESQTCQDHFYQMLYWENENPAFGAVHHLLVLCYYLQHPSLYSPEGLDRAKQLLVNFVDGRVETQAVRKQSQEKLGSDRRRWKITARPASHGSYHLPIRWRMTAGHVVQAGKERYLESVREWAASVLADLRVSGNLSQGPSQ